MKVLNYYLNLNYEIKIRKLTSEEGAAGLLKYRCFQAVYPMVKHLRKPFLISTTLKNAGLKLVWNWDARYRSL